MPKAWKAGWPLVVDEQQARELLEDLEADRPEQRADHSDRLRQVRVGEQPEQREEQHACWRARPISDGEHRTAASRAPAPEPDPGRGPPRRSRRRAGDAHAEQQHQARPMPG